MLQKIRIGTRLALAFAVFLLLIFALAAGGISGAKRLTERSAALYGDRTVPLGLLAEISHLTQHNRVLVMDMLMDPGTSNLQASHAALTSNVERIRTLWKPYAGKALGDQEQALAQAFAAANAAYLDQGLIPAASALVAGKYDDGSELYITQIRPNAAKVQAAIEALVALQIDVAAQEFALARQMSQTIHWWMLAATGLALVAGAAMAWVITRSISRPLRQAVVLAQLVPQLYTVERIEELLRQARRRFRQLGLGNIRSRHDDGKLGWADEAPFDAIILTAAGDTIPSRILEQLSPTGVLVAPVGSPSSQVLIRLRGDGQGDFAQEELGAVSFVPLLGGIG